MDLGTLVGAAFGAVVGTGSTMLADRFRWKRDRISRSDDAQREAAKQDLAARRAVYGEYLAALSLATHQLRGVLRTGGRTNTGLTGIDRTHRADEIMTESGAYRLRYQVRIIAPHLDKPVEDSFDALRGLRRCIASSAGGESDEQKRAIDEATSEIDASVDALLFAFHADLSGRDAS